MKITDFTEKHPLAKNFIKDLNKALKKNDSVAISEITKAKRVGGVTAMPLVLQLENGQSVTAYVRLITEDGNETFDLFRVDVNKKELPTSNRFSEDKAIFAKAVDEVAKAVLAGQAKFDKNRQKDSSQYTKKAQKATNAKRGSQLELLQQQVEAIDKEIAINEGVKADLQKELDELKAKLT